MLSQSTVTSKKLGRGALERVPWCGSCRAICRTENIGLPPQRKRLSFVPLCLRSEGCCLLCMSKAGSSQRQNPCQAACCFLTPLGSRKGHVFPHLRPLLLVQGQAQVGRLKPLQFTSSLQEYMVKMTLHPTVGLNRKGIAQFDRPRCQLA